MFRTDTPHDVASACLVADQAPGNDYLITNADKAVGEPGEYLEVMRALAQAHRWTEIIDVSGLEINRHVGLKAVPSISRFERYAALHTSFEALRRAVSEHVSPDAVDELFMTCLNHADVKLLAQVIPRAEVCYLPHGLGSIHAAENNACLREVARPPLARRSRRLVASVIKRPIWGVAATPPLSFDIAKAYSFNRPPAIGRLRYDLRQLMTPDLMRKLFLMLPVEMREPYDAIQKVDDSPAALLLTAPGGGTEREGYRYELELEALASLAVALRKNHGARLIVVKPHPRSNREWVAQVSEAVRAAVPGTRVEAITRYGAVPIEIALSQIKVAAVGGLGSSSLQTLATLYGIPTYSSDRALRELHETYPPHADHTEAWIRDNREHYTTI